MEELLTFIQSRAELEVEDEFETQLSRYNCLRGYIGQMPVAVPELPGFECSFAHWYLCFPKFHWRLIETSLSRQVLDGMVGKVNESKESAKIRSFNEIKIL